MGNFGLFLLYLVFTFAPFLWYNIFMIYEKIKIYVTKRIADVLSRDAESFGFLKGDGVTVNKNALLTALIVNYSDEFSEDRKSLHKLIRSTLVSDFVSEEKADALAADIANKVTRNLNSYSAEKFDCLVSLKPTKESQAIIDYAERYLLEGNSLSEYYRNMFSAYAALTQDKREEIIFRRQYERISEAIRSGKRVFLTTRKSKEKGLEVSPYAFARSKEEMHVYLLCMCGKGVKSIKLSSLASVDILSEDAEFTQEEIKIFKKMQEYGPQFTYFSGDEEVKVRLTREGEKLFRSLYVHRPVPKSVMGGEYVFDCSVFQVLLYFKRFGKEAYIVSPERVRESMKKFYLDGYNAYSEEK